MNRSIQRILLFLLIIFLDSPTCHSFNWFPSFSSSSPPETNSRSHENADTSFYRSNSEFSMEIFGNKKAVQRVEDVKNKLTSLNSCWQNAYKYLVSGCKDMVATEDKRKRFAWHLTDCFFKDSGRLNFPTLQRLAEFSQKQQEELAKRQEQLQQVHDHLGIRCGEFALHQ